MRSTTCSLSQPTQIRAPSIQSTFGHRPRAQATGRERDVDGSGELVPIHFETVLFGYERIKGSIELWPTLVEIGYFEKKRRGLPQLRVANREA